MALSKRFSDCSELLIGTPPNSKKTTLSRKVQSELNLATLHKIRPAPSITDSAASVFTRGSGDALPDETSVLSQMDMQPATECNAFIALRELGTLVARRRGLQPDSFSDGLMLLLSQSRPADPPGLDSNEKESNPASSQDVDVKKQSLEQAVNKTCMVGSLQSQPQVSTQQGHHRQFSFEPGTDELQALSEEAMLSDLNVHDSDPQGSVTQLSMDAGCYTPGSPSASLAWSTSSLSAKLCKPSKIPSPVQSLGRSRKESSASSLQSMHSKSQESRRGSRSSVVTAFRENSSGRVERRVQSRDSSLQSMRTELHANSQTDAAAASRPSEGNQTLGTGTSGRRPTTPPRDKRQGRAERDDDVSKEM
jgi:hypothetical protein